jgi:hypothetical protein
MTETEWLACPDRDMLLDHVFPRAGRRKLRLFLCALARRLWDRLSDPRSRRAVEMAEELADAPNASDFYGLETMIVDQWIEARKEASAALAGLLGSAFYRAAAVACYTLSTLPLSGHSHYVKVQASHAAAAWGFVSRPDHALRRKEMQAQCRILRDLFGNPFRPPGLDPAWLRWRDGAVKKWARRIYEERRFDELPVLGDALEEAGCIDRTTLAHCRGSGEHVRGCWVVDLLLGKS